MRARLLEETERYFRGGDDRSHFTDVESNELFTLATLLDPRYKKSGFSSQSKAVAAEALLREKMTEMELNRTSQSLQEVMTGDAGEATTDDWADCMGLNDPEISAGPTANTVETELQDYLAEKILERQKSPFVWWSVNEHKYPNLGLLAKRYLCAPMGSIASEREFKVAKRVINGRWNLKAQNVERLLFLKYNLRMIGYSLNI